MKTVTHDELRNFGLLQIKKWGQEAHELEDGGREMSSIELPGSEETVKIRVQETLGAILGARVLIRENDTRLLSIQQELRNQFERSGKTSISEAELMDYVRHYFRIRKA